MSLLSELLTFVSSEFFALLVTAIITFVITYVVQIILDRPKVRGSIFNVISADWTQVSKVDGSSTTRTAYFVYLYLTNYHQHSINILDYELEIDYGSGYEKILRVYGDVSKAIPDPMKATDQDGKLFEMVGWSKHLIYKETKPVQFGDFIHGFVMFAGDISLHKKKTQKIKVTCVDVFKKRHVIEATPKEYLNLFLLQEILETSTH